MILSTKVNFKLIGELSIEHEMIHFGWNSRNKMAHKYKQLKISSENTSTINYLREALTRDR